MKLAGRNLGVGAVGDDVALLQTELRLLGYQIPNSENGRFQRATLDALQAFERNQGLPVGDQVTEDIARSINAAVDQHAQTPPPRVQTSVSPTRVPSAPSPVPPIERPPDESTVPVPPVTTPPKIRGRVIALDGPCPIGCRQIVLFGSDESRTSPTPFFAAKSDSGGYFFADAPATTYKQTYAVVSGLTDASGSPQLSVRLAADGSLPSPLLLVGKVLPSASADDACCDCTDLVPRAPSAGDLVDPNQPYSQDLGSGCGGGCHFLKTPNRTLESFTYWSLVRWYEPARLMDALPSFVPAPGVKPPPLPPTMLLHEDGFAPKLDHSIWMMPKDASPTAPSLGHLRGQAVNIGYGHVLTFRQSWKAHGYSLGDLLYSVPLAPCQKKNIAVVDWQRKETYGRQESAQLQDTLTNQLTRDRDIQEIVNTALSEQIAGRSAATTQASAGGAGVAGSYSGGTYSLGAAAAFFAGQSLATSNASQQGNRDLVARSLQNVQDRTAQAASNVRSYRTSVVQSVGQDEKVLATTEVIANHNHCHALTIEYFEVLRHFLVEHELASVDECLFVPFLITRFDATKALRWQSVLRPRLLVPAFADGFDALAALQDESGQPISGDDTVITASVTLQVQFQVAFPIIASQFPGLSAEVANFGYSHQTDSRDIEEETKDRWQSIRSLLERFGVPDAKEWGHDWFQAENKGIQNEGASWLDRLARLEKEFLVNIAPRLAPAYFKLLDAEFPGASSSPASKLIVSLMTPRGSDGVFTVTIRPAAPLNLKRSQLQRLRLGSLPTLPVGSQVIVANATLSYTTTSGKIVQASSVECNVDLARRDANPPTTNQSIEIVFPLHIDSDNASLRSRADLLVDHLNENVDYYHQVLWTSLDAAKREMLLETIEYTPVHPSPGTTSKPLRVGSIVENTPLGFVGNSMVFPVSKRTPPLELPNIGTTWFEVYQQDDGGASGVTRVSVPTGGVFAEAMMGECNACEKKDETRFWDWQQSPCPEEPTAIQPVSTDTRATTPPNLQTSLPGSILNIQNPPALPDPTGLAAALQVIGRPDLFRDLTGVQYTNQNALGALQAVSQGAQALAADAVGVAKQQIMQRGGLDKAIDAIKAGEKGGYFDKKQAGDLMADAIRTSMGGKPSGETLSTGDSATQSRQATTTSTSTNPSPGSGARPKGPSAKMRTIIFNLKTDTGLQLTPASSLLFYLIDETLAARYPSIDPETGFPTVVPADRPQIQFRAYPSERNANVYQVSVPSTLTGPTTVRILGQVTAPTTQPPIQVSDTAWAVHTYYVEASAGQTVDIDPTIEHLDHLVYDVIWPTVPANFTVTIKKDTSTADTTRRDVSAKVSPTGEIKGGGKLSGSIGAATGEAEASATLSLALELAGGFSLEHQTTVNDGHDLALSFAAKKLDTSQAPQITPAKF